MDAMKRCAACAMEINAEAKKCPHCRSRQPGVGTMYRVQEGKVIAGVCNGLALQLGIDVTAVRVVFALLALMSVGLVFWAYLFLWVLTPSAPYEKAPLERLTDSLRNLFGSQPSGQPRSL